LNTFFVALNMILGIAIPVALQLWDRRFLSREEREWLWNYASWGSAVYNFGPFSLVAWGYVTRSPRYWRGLFFGMLLTWGALLAQGTIGEIVGRALGFRDKQLVENRQSILILMGAATVLAAIIGAGRAAYELVRPRRRAPP
jgi:hypothetical protein